MSKLDMFLLTMLAGIGWACAFALVGFAMYLGVSGNGWHASVFAAFGFGAGAGLAALRMAIEWRLPASLMTGWRARQAREAAEAPSIEPAVAAQSAFH